MDEHRPAPFQADQAERDAGPGHPDREEPVLLQDRYRFIDQRIGPGPAGTGLCRIAAESGWDNEIQVRRFRRLRPERGGTNECD